MDQRPDKPTYSALFAILLILLLLIAIAKTGLQTFVRREDDREQVIRIDGRTPITRESGAQDARAFVERALNATESDRRALESLRSRLEG